MTPFGQKIRQIRRTKNVSLKEMAEGVGVSSAYLSALEHGKRGTPTWAMVQRIIAYFNIIWDEAEELQRLAEISNPRIVAQFHFDGDPRLVRVDEFFHATDRALAQPALLI